LPDLIIVLWRTNFKSIPLETKQRLQQYYCYSCLDVETSCRDGGFRGMPRVSGCTLRTLYFVNSGEVASDEMLLITLLLMTLLLMTLLLITCLQERFLHTHFFIRFSSDAFLSDALSFNKNSFALWLVQSKPLWIVLWFGSCTLEQMFSIFNW